MRGAFTRSVALLLALAPLATGTATTQCAGPDFASVAPSECVNAGTRLTSGEGYGWNEYYCACRDAGAELCR